MTLQGMSLRFSQLATLCLAMAFCGVLFANNAILPVPEAQEQQPEKVQLGDQLFHDVRLSSDNSISCASCHDLAHNGADRRPFSVGVEGALGRIRAPSVYNSQLNHVQFWDGKAPDLETQVDGPVHNPVEMASNWDDIVTKLSQDPDRLAQFNALFVDGITPANIRSALASFQRTLMLTNAPFDRWLQGDENAISAEEHRGYEKFRDLGCISCHQGANVGGNMFARMGSLENYFEQKGESINRADLGRFNVTGQEHHRYVFKVPGLRTASLNSFFFHDSSAETLEDAIVIMARFQLGRELAETDITELAAFIRSLTGEHPRLNAVKR
ncbi:cytochrome-c peroxidase [Nitrincola sp.]|uniref:cytochrome-c peroxidase n=1 Tax=Nitrincola sp. TaxID=1926584 RepID=UPI003A905238